MIVHIKVLVCMYAFNFRSVLFLSSVSNTYTPCRRYDLYVCIETRKEKKKNLFVENNSLMYMSTSGKKMTEVLFSI